jgi:3-oxoadipate enol-lactonase
MKSHLWPGHVNTIGKQTMKQEQIGWKELAAIDGQRGEQTVAYVRETSALLAENLVEHAFGNVFARTTLSRREREMVTLGILGAIGGAEPQLRIHLDAALRVGAHPDELVAIAEHMSVYGGYPRALNLLREVRDAVRAAGEPLPITTRKVTLDDHQTRVFDSGCDKPALILVHALGLDHRMWREVIPLLADQFRVIAYDLRGYGAAAGAPVAQGLATYATDLVTVLDRLEIDSAHVVGLSLGGSIAQHLALSRPERMQSLTVVASTAWPFDAFTERARAAERDGMAAQVIPSLTRWFRPEDLAQGGWAVRYARDSVERAFVADWVAGWHALATIETGSRLGEIRMPTHVIAGERDASTSPALMKRMLEIPGATYSEIAGAPHMVSLTHPRPLAEAILRGINACTG